MITAEERKRRAAEFLRTFLTKETFEAEKERWIPASREAGGEDEGETESAGGRAMRVAEASMEQIGRVTKGEQEVLDDDSQFTTEAIIYPDKRPVAYIRNGTYEDFTGEWDRLNTAVARTTLQEIFASVGRVERPAALGGSAIGTSFVVGNDLLMTNRHVAEFFASGLGRQRLRFTAGDAAVDFLQEIDTPAADRSVTLDVRNVVMIHPYWDMALLEVRGLPPQCKPLRFSTADPRDAAGRIVATVGFPLEDPRNPRDVQEFVFGRQFGVKRLQPGLAAQMESKLSFQKTVTALTHDCSTLGGNSGSCVVDVETGELLGLHFAGKYLLRNYAVPSREFARDARVRDAGIHFGGNVGTDNEWESYWSRIENNTREGAKQVPPTPPQASSAKTATWNIPLQISVTLGAAELTTASLRIEPATQTVDTAVTTEALQLPVIYDSLETRDGFNADYLGLPHPVPLPALTTKGKAVAAKLEDGSHELKYHHFSVYMHRGRRLALLTASNVDFRKASRTINGKTFTRAQLSGLPENAQEEWATDWRIPMEHQLPDVFFTKDRKAFDKGHLVRRDDVAYGTTFEDIQMANGDTYHTTNCSPQVKGFNQSQHGEFNWGDLENLVQKQTSAETAIVFAGPVLTTGDRPFFGVSEQGQIAIRIPSQYWKIVVVNQGGSPAAYAFLLKQDLSAVDFGEEEFVVDKEWRKRMVPIAEIETALNGWVKFTALKPFDQFNTDEAAPLAASLEPGQ